MNHTENNNQNKTNRILKIVLPLVILLCFIGIFLMIYRNFAPDTQTGTKQIEVSVVDDTGESTTYVLTTDAEFLKDALDEIDTLEYSGTDSAYGIMVDTVNGLTADYEADGAYWSFYVNDDYCNYGIESQPVNDGDRFSIVYEK